MKTRLAAWLVPRLICLVYYTLSATVRWKTIGRSFSPEDKQRYIYAFWHARMLMMPRPFRKRWHGYMLISEHRDGAFIADAMHRLGIPTVRGSTTRGGARAMLRMIRAVKREHRHLGITPDGPKGPREEVQKGTVQLAMKTGLAMVPLCYATSRQWRARSWDRFYIPKPFTRGVFVFGDPVKIEAGEQMDVALQRFQQAMDRIQRQADDYVKQGE
ncbi:MAG TPA: lysophospholipid acyltransferase family protein [Mariprofundaceae bacterium]|nr:lysophospholipid acyltransferase family protein [Mariprofundaceae bacterium]